MVPRYRNIEVRLNMKKKFFGTGQYQTSQIFGSRFDFQNFKSFDGYRLLNYDPAEIYLDFQNIIYLLRFSYAFETVSLYLIMPSNVQYIYTDYIHTLNLKK